MDQLYFLSLPFVSAFNFSQIFVIPLVVCMLGLILRGATGQIKHLPLTQLDKLVALFLASALLSTTINANSLNSKTVNHLLAVFAGWLLFYFAAERLAQRLSIERILHLLFIGYIATIVFGIFEFTVANFTDLDINAMIPRPAVEGYTPGFLSILLIRARSFFEESGYFAAYMAMLAPLMVHYLWHIRTERWLRIAFVVLTLIGYFIAFSISLFIFLPAAVFIAHLLRSIFLRGHLSRKAILAYSISLAAIITIISTPLLMDEVFLRKFDGNSFDDRQRRFSSTIELISESHWVQQLFGYGPGSYFYLNVEPAGSMYLNFLRDFGALGLIAFLLIQGYAAINMMLGTSALSKALFTSIIVELLFFVSTPIYFLPHYYLPLLLYRMHIVRSRKSSPSLSTAYSRTKH